MNCQICGTDKITMREHEKENHKPLYHTSLFVEGVKTQEIDIVFCSAKCSLEFYQNKTK